MVGSLAGQTAIVTGGSRGYGMGTAKVLVEQGAKVWITGRDEVRLKEAAAHTGAQAVKADACSPADWDKLVGVVLEQAGRIDVLVNNVGAGVRIAPVAEQTDAEIETGIAVNLTSAILGCRRVAPIMRQQQSGTIINVASVCATEAWPGWSVYSAAKAGLLQFSKCLYTEMRPHQVRVTCLIPSWGATEFAVAAALPVDAPEVNAKKIQPTEFGDVVAFLCSMPAHLAVEQMIVWPLVQQVEPL